MVFKVFNKCIKNYEIVNSIEGPVASNYLFIMASVKTKIWSRKISKRFLNDELIFIQTFSIGFVGIFYYLLVGFITKGGT